METRSTNTSPRIKFSRGEGSKTLASSYLTQPERTPKRIARSEQSPKKIENAVYGYARAVRALDRKTVTVSEISSALSISESDVIKAIKMLSNKGIKLAK